MLLRVAAGRLRSPATAPAVRRSTAALTQSLAAKRAHPAGARPSPFSTKACLLAQNRFTPPPSNNNNKPASPPPQNKSQKPERTPADSETQPPPPEAEPEKEIPLSALPDLTQGIPSTLDFETAGATNRAALAPYVEETAAGASSGGGRTKGKLPASAYVSSFEKRRKKLANYMFFGSLGLAVLGTVYAGRDWDEEEARRHPEVPNGWGLGLWWARVSTRIKEVLTYYHEPAFEKLLPDPHPQFGRPYTLCISLEDMLVHSEWTREHGWRIAKRPGVDYFLHYLSQYYEIVLFTTVPFGLGETIVRKLDPYHFIMWPLFREATKYKDGEIVKDLSYLNRDLSKVIIIDTNPSHVRAQPENAIVLPKWEGDPTDKELVGLIPFLEYIFAMEYGDVRKVIKSFEGTNIPKEFARREAIARAEFQKQLEAQNHKKRHSGSIGGLGSLLGIKTSNMGITMPPDGEVGLPEQLAQGKMLQDIVRERGQKNYEMLEKQIREEGDMWLKEEAAQQEKMQQEAMKNMKQSFSGWFVNQQAASPAPAPSSSGSDAPSSAAASGKP